MSKPKTTSLNNGQPLKARKGRRQSTLRPQATQRQSRPLARKKHRPHFDELLGQGANLWDDLEFERFQAWLRETRSSGE